MGDPRVRDVIELNKAVGFAHEDSGRVWDFSSHWDGRYSEAVIFGCADSSLGNVDDAELGEKTKSQAGYVVGLRDPQSDRVHILECNSGTIKRVCRSTLAAEANGVVEGVESCDWVRMLVAELDGKIPCARELRREDQGDLRPAHFYTDPRLLGGRGVDQGGPGARLPLGHVGVRTVVTNLDTSSPGGQGADQGRATCAGRTSTPGSRSDRQEDPRGARLVNEEAQ